MGWSIFSSTPNRDSKNSAVLHQTNIKHDNEGLVDVAVEELVSQGHRITGVLRVPAQQQSGNQTGHNRAGRRR